MPSVLTPTFLSLCQSNVLARIRSVNTAAIRTQSNVLKCWILEQEKKSQEGIWSPLHFSVESPEPGELLGCVCSAHPSQRPDSSPASGACAANSGTVCFLLRPPGRPASHTWNAPLSSGITKSSLVFLHDNRLLPRAPVRDVKQEASVKHSH